MYIVQAKNGKNTKWGLVYNLCFHKFRFLSFGHLKFELARLTAAIYIIKLGLPAWTLVIGM